MSKNQLFREFPTLDFFKEFVTYYGLKDLNDSRIFTKEQLVNLKTLEKINENIEKLESIYIPCKKEKYLKNLTEKKSITVLRQIAKVFQYKVVTREKFQNGKKILVYSLNKDIPDNDYVNYNLKLIEF